MQSTTLLCDRCSMEIDLNNRVQVFIATAEPIADPQIDLCMDCAAPVLNTPVVKEAHAGAHARMMERIRTNSPQPEVVSPELPPDDYEPQGGNPRR